MKDLVIGIAVASLYVFTIVMIISAISADTTPEGRQFQRWKTCREYMAYADRPKCDVLLQK